MYMHVFVPLPDQPMPNSDDSSVVTVAVTVLVCEFFLVVFISLCVVVLLVLKKKATHKRKAKNSGESNFQEDLVLHVRYGHIPCY